MPKEELYKQVKIVGMISFIPIVLAAGPLTGYAVGSYLQKRFDLSAHVTNICIAAGFISSLMEVVKIIRIVLKTAKKP